MRILVTGSTGFIGRALTRQLLAAGHYVRCATRAPTATPAGADMVTIGDIGASPDWRGALEGVNVVVHLAGLAHMPVETQVAAGSYGTVNAGGTRSLALAAAAAGVERVILLSTVGVNGEASGECPFREEDVPAPKSRYALSKLEAEQRLIDIAGRHAMGWCIVRPPLVYGPHASGNFRRLVGLIARGWPLPLASATAKRSYIALDNLTSILIRTLDAPQARNALFLVSDGEDISTADFIRCLAKHMHADLRLLPAPPALVRAAAAAFGRSRDARRLFDRLQIDTSRLRQRLAWKPVVTLDEGLRRAVGM